jgi:hypothetical protein
MEERNFSKQIYKAFLGFFEKEKHFIHEHMALETRVAPDIQLIKKPDTGYPLRLNTGYPAKLEITSKI